MSGGGEDYLQRIDEELSRLHDVIDRARSEIHKLQEHRELIRALDRKTVSMPERAGAGAATAVGSITIRRLPGQSGSSSWDQRKAKMTPEQLEQHRERSRRNRIEARAAVGLAVGENRPSGQGPSRHIVAILAFMRSKPRGTLFSPAELRAGIGITHGPKAVKQEVHNAVYYMREKHHLIERDQFARYRLTENGWTRPLPAP